MIPFSKTQNQKSDITEIKRALKNAKLEGGGQFSLKVNHKLNKLGYKNNLLTTSCTSALEMSAILLDLKKGDEILIPSLCWSTSLWPIIQSGLKPKFVDIEKDTLNIDLKDLKSKITKKTKGMLIVHVLGNSTNMNELMKIKRKHNLYLIEDTCESLGTKYKNKYLGSFGEFASFSFYSSHQISSGEGGMITTNNKLIDERIKMFKFKITPIHN